MKTVNTVLPGPEALKLLHRMDAYWRAASYISVGQLYRHDNPLLKKPLELPQVKPLVVGHWGTTPGQNFIYVHLNPVIEKYDPDMFYIAGADAGQARRARQYTAKHGQDMPEIVKWTWGGPR